MKKIPILFLLLFMINSCSSAKTQLLNKPYLQAVTQNSIIIMVERWDKTPVQINYGLDKNYTQNSSTTYTLETENKVPTYVHRIVLEKLQPQTKYYYKLKLDSSVFESEFTTSALSGASFKFAVTGDFRSNPSVHNQVMAGILKFNPLFSIYTGDICFNSSYNSFKEEFFVDNQLTLASKTPYVNAVGNHEDWSQNTQAFIEAPNSKSNHKAYFDFDYGDIHFVIISTEHSVEKNSEQWKFVENSLKSTDKKWKIVAYHEPAYAAGGHNENDKMINMTSQIFEPNKVNLILNGHSHFYQRNFVNGINHLVLAGGGAPLYAPGTASYTVKSAKTHHFAIVDASPDTLNLNVYDLNGNIIDNLKLSK